MPIQRDVNMITDVLLPLCGSSVRVLSPWIVTHRLRRFHDAAVHQSQPLFSQQVGFRRVMGHVQD